jgi:hypothetical protein
MRRAERVSPREPGTQLITESDVEPGPTWGRIDRRSGARDPRKEQITESGVEPGSHAAGQA